MLNNVQMLLIAGISCAAMQTALAAEEVAANPWSGSLEPSLLIQSGNSDVQSFSGSARLSKRSNRWQHSINASIDYVKTEGETSEDTYRGSYGIRYSHESNYVIFNDASYETMRIQQYDSIIGNTTGLERTYQWRDDLRFTGAIGVGYRATKTTANKETESMTQTLRGTWNWQINPDVSLVEAVSIQTGNFGSELTTTNSVTTLNTKLSENTSVVLSFNLNHLSEVPSGRKLTMSGRAGMRFDF